MSTARTLRIPADVELDLGSTGKGLAADLGAAAALAAAGPGAGVLVSLGGDIATAGRAPDGGWRIPWSRTARSIPRTPSRRRSSPSPHGAVATSSHHGPPLAFGGRRHRPPHRRPAHGGSATVTPGEPPRSSPETCETANAASTAAIVLGDAAPAWLEAAGLPGAARGPRRVRPPPRRLARAGRASRPATRRRRARRNRTERFRGRRLGPRRTSRERAGPLLPDRTPAHL